jgi:hypothetical protein
MQSAYAIRVNVHNLNWNGHVCSSPVAHDDCRARVDFRSAYCARGYRKCFFLSLFAPLPRLRLPASQMAYQQVFAEQRPEAGDLAIFWATYREGTNIPVGVWRIEAFDDTEPEFELRGDPDHSVRFAPRVANFDVLAQRVSRSIGSDMIRLIAPMNVPTILERFMADHEQELQRLRDDGRSTEDVQATLSGLRGLVEALPESARFGNRIVVPADLLSAAGRGAAHTPQPVSALSRTRGEERRPMPTPSGGSPAVAVEPAATAETHPLPFPIELVNEYAVAVRVSSLVILAGPSGAGKTRLTRDYAARTGAQYTLIAVRPDWRANEDLLGYLPPFDGDFVPYPFTTFVGAALEEWKAALAAGRTPRPYHCCLDEMNLARPEYYLAEVLSKLELEPDDRVLHLYEATTDRAYPKRLQLPPNLVIVGTVNNDDTTHALSPKVLDRAIYLNIDSIDLRAWFSGRPSPAAELAGPLLIELDGILREASFRVGYRVAGQVVRWVEEAMARGIDRHAGLDTALATIVLAKLRLQQSEPTHREVLDRVRVYLETLAGPDSDPMPRSLALLRRLASSLDRRQFVFGQFETS